jgi:MFS family permease
VPKVHQDAFRPAGSSPVALLAMAWLVIDLGIAYKTVREGVLADTQVLLIIPSITAAALVAGAAIGLLAVGRLAERFGGIERAVPRVLSGAIGGAAVAILAVAGMLTAYHRGVAVAAMAITVAVAAIGGGALAAARPSATIAAGLAGSLAYTVVSVIAAFFRDSLLRLFGAGADTVAAYTSAESRLSLVVALLTGTIAGATAFVFLRRSGLTLPWPAYLAAGAVPGALLLLADLVAWIGATSLRSTIGALSEFDRLSLSMLQPAKTNSEMIVFFVGTVTAVILVGRTMQSSPSSQDRA